MGLGPFQSGFDPSEPEFQGPNINPRTGETVLPSPSTSGGDGFWTTIKTGAAGAFDDIFGAIGRGARDTFEVLVEQGRKVIEEDVPIWARKQFERQQEDQLDDPTAGDVFATLRRRLADALDFTDSFEADEPGSLFGIFGDVQRLADEGVQTRVSLGPTVFLAIAAVGVVILLASRRS